MNASELEQYLALATLLVVALLSWLAEEFEVFRGWQPRRTQVVVAAVSLVLALIALGVKLLAEPGTVTGMDFLKLCVLAIGAFVESQAWHRTINRAGRQITAHDYIIEASALSLHDTLQIRVIGPDGNPVPPERLEVKRVGGI